MATIKSETSSDRYKRSFPSGSDDIDEVICQPCSTENLHLKAVGYCQHCHEYMCDTCYTCHRKSAATRFHRLLDIADMHNNKVMVTDELKEKCPKHQDKLLAYFCNTHIDLCCINCLHVEHGSCTFISHIPDVSDGIASGNEYTDLMIDLRAQVSMLTKQQEIIRLSTKDNDTYQSEYLAGIREFRKEVDKMLDKYEEDAVKKVYELHSDNSEKINVQLSKVQARLSDLTAMIGALDAKAKGNKNNQLFVDIQLSRQSLSVMEAGASDVTDFKITQYGFRQDVKIKALLSTLSAVWSLSLIKDCEETKARYLGELNTKTDDDTADCTITGIAILPGDDIVIADFNNKALKLVDIKVNKVKSRVSLSSLPLDVTNAKPNQVAVSLGTEGKIEIYTVTDALTRSNTINVGQAGIDGIFYAGDRFILTCFHKGLVKIIDLSGRLIRNISKDMNGHQLFVKPRYVAVGPNRDIAYVSDPEAHTFTTMKLDSGHVISVYRNEKLKCPRGVTVGADHKVYVCSEDTHTVFQFSATGEFQQVLLNTLLPFAIAFDDTRHRLYISCGNNLPGDRNFVKYFQLE